MSLSGVLLKIPFSECHVALWHCHPLFPLQPPLKPPSPRSMENGQATLLPQIWCQHSLCLISENILMRNTAAGIMKLWSAWNNACTLTLVKFTEFHANYINCNSDSFISLVIVAFQLLGTCQSITGINSDSDCLWEGGGHMLVCHITFISLSHIHFIRPACSQTS